MATLPPTLLALLVEVLDSDGKGVWAQPGARARTAQQLAKRGLVRLVPQGTGHGFRVFVADDDVETPPVCGEVRPQTLGYTVCARSPGHRGQHRTPDGSSVWGRA